MASRVLQLILELQDKATKELESTFKDWEAISDKVGKAFTVAGGAITGAFGLAIKSAFEAETAVARLTKITQNSVGASEEQIQALIDQAVALERIGVVSAGATMAAQGTLSTFDLQTESIQRLIPAFLDMVVAERGVNATTDDMIGLANGLGKVLQGQVGALSKQGFIFDKATENLLKYGTEAQKVEALVDILNSTYEGLNETLADTPEGQIAQLKNQFGALSEQIGQIFIPIAIDVMNKIKSIMDRVEEWAAKNPKLFETIAKVTAVVGLLMLALGPVLIALPGIVMAIKAVGAAFVLLTGPIGIVIAAIAAIVASILYIKTHWDDVVWGFNQGIEFLRGLWTGFSEWIMGILNSIAEFFSNTWNALSEKIVSAWTAIKDFFSTIWQGILNVVTSFISFIVGFVVSAFNKLGIDIVAVLETIKNTFSDFWNAIKSAAIALFDWFIQFVSDSFGYVSEAFTAGLQVIQDAWTVAWNAIGDFLSGIWETIKMIVGLGWDWMINKFKAAAQPVRDAWNNLWGGVGETLRTMWEGIKSMITSGINWVIGKINGLIEKINAVIRKGADVLGIEAKTIGTISLLGNDMSDIGSKAAIGGASAQAVIPQSRSMQQGQISVTNNISGSVVTERELSGAIQTSIMDAIRLNQRIPI